MRGKITDKGALAGYWQEGMSLAVGGQSVFANPMGLLREVLRSGVGRLQLVCSPVGGLGVDLLIGAERVAGVEFAQVSLWEFGLAPHFRRAVQGGRLELKEHA